MITRISHAFVILSVFSFLGLAAEEDVVRAKLDAAMAAYHAESEELRARVFEFLDTRENAARKKGDKKLVDKIKEERLGFDSKGIQPGALPKSIATRFASSRANLEAAYRIAIREYTKGKEDEKASAVEKQLDQFLRGKNVPSDAVVFQNKNYKAVSEQLTWREAKAKCESVGGHLVVIDSSAENAFVTKLASDAKLSAVWLGASDQNMEGKWQTLDGVSLKYENWDRQASQPNNASGVEHYIALIVSKQGLWWDYPDDPKAYPNLTGAGKPGYICEWE